VSVVSKDRDGGRSFLGFFEWFVRSEVSGSALLLAAAVAAMALANSPWSARYFEILGTYVGVSWAGAAFELSLQHWINDGLMVVFFFVVGLEIKRELLVGELSSLKKAVLPVAAAVGGMAFPALLFAAFNHGGAAARGWGIPMATDIAFALGALAMFGSRVPLGLKVFLMAVAIADDLGAVAVIAIFYTSEIKLLALAAAGALLAALFAAIRMRVRRRGILYLLIAGIWLAVFSSGVHATVAGILVAMMIPVRPRVDPAIFIEEAGHRLERMRQLNVTADSLISDREHLDHVESVHAAAEDALPAGLVLERVLHPIQVWLILPLFALANAGVRLEGDVLEVLAQPLALGILVGLVVGKPLGIVLLSWLAVRSGHGALPDGVSWRHVIGVGCLAGIGFTMSLFISGLAFLDTPLMATAKVGILSASLTSTIIGIVLLSWALPEPGA
jgi:NhaA family Na+:H+ antiporter